LRGGDGGPAVVPGKARASRLYRAAAHLDEPHMPPRDEKGGPLNGDQLALLARWIDLGAPYDRPLLDRTDPPPRGTAGTAAVPAGPPPRRALAHLYSPVRRGPGAHRPPPPLLGVPPFEVPRRAWGET